MSSTLSGEIIQVLGPDELENYALGEPLQVLSEGNHIAVIDDTDYYDDSLKTRLLSTLLLRHIDPPPTLIIPEPPFETGHEVRLRAERSHLEKVFVDPRDVEVL